MFGSNPCPSVSEAEAVLHAHLGHLGRSYGYMLGDLAANPSWMSGVALVPNLEGLKSSSVA